jgi:hypothetical protein
LVLVVLVAHLLVAQEQVVQITGQLVLILCLAPLLQMVEAAAGMVTRAMALMVAPAAVVLADLLERVELGILQLPLPVKEIMAVHPLVLIYLENLEGLEVVAHLRLAITDKQTETVAQA